MVNINQLWIESKEEVQQNSELEEEKRGQNFVEKSIGSRVYLKL
jgi:hypothetical protein